MNVLHTTLFYTTSIKLNNFAPARNRIPYPLLVPVRILPSQPLLRFFNHLIITPKPFPIDANFQGRKEVQI
jgi:hypothetical protein